MGLTTTAKGHLALLKVEERAIQKGWLVSRPSTDAPYDLILDEGTRLYRVQVKYANGKSNRSNGAVIVNLRHRRGGSRRRDVGYQDGEIDAIVVYLPSLSTIAWLNPEAFRNKQAFHFRFAPPRSGIKSGFYNVSDFEW